MLPSRRHFLRKKVRLFKRTSTVFRSIGDYLPLTNVVGDASLRAQTHILPTTANQDARLWFEEVCTRYRRPLASTDFAVGFRPTSPLNIDAIEQTLADVVARHAALRTTFAPSGAVSAPIRAFRAALFAHKGMFVRGMYHATLHEQTRLKISRRVVEGTDVGGIRAALLREQIRVSHYTGPVCAAAVVNNGRGDLLVVIVSHLAVDGHSLRLLRREIVSGYDARVNGKPAQPVPAAVPHHEFARREENRLIAGDLDESVTFWRERWKRLRAALISYSDLAFLASCESWQPHVAVQKMKIDRDHSRVIFECARSLRVTPHVYFQAALSALLHLKTRKHRIAVWTNFNNRDEEFESTVGWFAHSHMILSETTARTSYGELCQRLSRELREAQEHQALPLSTLWDEIGENVSVNDTHISFDLLDNRSAVGGGEHLVPIPELLYEPQWADLDVRTIIESDGEITLSIVYNVTRYRQDGIQAMLADLRSTAIRMSSRPDGTIQ